MLQNKYREELRRATSRQTFINALLPQSFSSLANTSIYNALDIDESEATAPLENRTAKAAVPTERNEKNKAALRKNGEKRKIKAAAALAISSGSPKNSKKSETLVCVG